MLCDTEQEMSELIQPPEIAQGEVQQFFSGRCVLLTGATGFCGKVLLEKLLRSCPGLDNVYIVVRPRRGQDIRDRVTNLLNQSLFVAVSPEALKKVVPVAGDLLQPGLGLSLHDKELLCQRVSVVFHMAASVRFDDNLHSAMETNVWATEAIVKLSKSMSQLKALVYVSTAYSNCIREEIEEKVYNPVANPEELYKSLATMPPDEMAPIESMILQQWPNTYTFTKAMAENMLKETCETLPVAIFRPSIVTCMWKEPEPGWVDSINGPTLCIMGGALGKMRCGLLRKNYTTDMVPVDMVASGLIATAWDTARCSDRTMPRVYNFVSGSRNPIKWSQFLEYGKKCNEVYPSAKAAWYYMPIFTHHKSIYIFVSLLMELLPALLMDLVPYLSTGKHRNLDMYLKVNRFLKTVSHFSLRQWTFRDDNVVALLEKMSPEDKAVFQMDVTDIKWREYIWSYVQGVRKHMLKDSPSTLPAARRRYYRLYLLHNAVMLALLAVLCACVFYFTR